MKSFLTHKSLNMSIGLIPVIICMICCLFFPDRVVLYAGSLGSIVYVLYRQIRPTVYQPNLVLLYGTLALFITSVMKGIGDNWLIPDNTTSITLEIFILSLSLSYILAPGWYQKFFSYFHFQVPAVNSWAMRVVAFLSGIHLLVFSLLYLFLNPLPSCILYIFEQILPPILYITCIVLNDVLINIVYTVYEKMPSLRIAPVCNGKIYVVPRTDDKYMGLDLPIEGYIYGCNIEADRYAKKMLAKDYGKYLTGTPEPRFSLKYLMNIPDGKRAVLLYVLPLNDESEIHFPEGKFVTPEEIENHPDRYSTFLKEEIDHLSVVAKMWEEFK